MPTKIEEITEEWRKEAHQLRGSGLYRETVKSSEISSCIDFSSNDYLGLSEDPRLHESGSKSVFTSGSVGSGASRVVLQRDKTLDELEKFVANWVNFPSTTYCASGFLANCVLFSAIANLNLNSQQSTIFLDHRAHASLFAATRMSQIHTVPFRHGDMASLRLKVSQSSAHFKIIVVEALHSMDGTFEAGAELANICKEFNAVVIIDEAHSMGLYGPLGSGWINTFPELKKHTLAVMFGCGKAVGISGGFIAGSEELRERIFQKSKPFIYTTGVSPFLSGAVLKACQILASDEGESLRNALFQNVAYFKKLVSPLEVNKYSPIFSLPVSSVSAALALEGKLASQGFIVRAMRPPTVPRNSPRLRIIIRAPHLTHQLSALAKAVTVGNIL